MKVVAVIACYNEEKTIAGVVAEAKKHCKRVIVVDNDSSDNTRVEAEKELPCFNIYSCYVKGAGIATAYGLAYSLNPLKHLYGDVIVTLDGDGQHNPSEIPTVVEPIKKGEADVVIGSRFLNEYKIPKYRKFGIDVITWLYNLGSERNITDGQCCFRAYSRDALKELMPIKEDGFSYSVETLIKARARGLRIVEVPVSCIYHEEYSQNSSISPLRHGLGVVFGVLKWKLMVEVFGVK